ncbi:MAG TPA: hypothetical protein VFJ58_11150 [Armatimonadota bacterium]|nr:hypothetical protein [Armatimonadota bacterium]
MSRTAPIPSSAKAPTPPRLPAPARSGFSLAYVLIAGLIMTGSSLTRTAAATLPSFDFTKPEIAREWQPTHDIAALQPTPEGMRIIINGNDPYTIGPARDYPAGQSLWMRVRLKSDQQGSGQFFYFNDHPTEENSVHFPVKAGAWVEAVVPMPPLGPGYHLRFDPPGTGGACILQSISFATRTIFRQPAWAVSPAPHLGRRLFSIQSGDLKLIRNPTQPGGFALEVAGERMAVGWTRPLIGYLHGSAPRWIDLSKAAVRVRRDGDSLVVTTAAHDPDGGTWTIRRTFTPTKKPGAIDAVVQVTVNRRRSVIFLPMLVILPGVGSFGEQKGQGLFAGVEYLDNEPSSSTADLTVPAHNREVPDVEKITAPLMVIQAHDRYVGLIWKPESSFSALFDSPDRIFKSGGHVMGILFPGSNGFNRPDGGLLPYSGGSLTPAHPLTLHATIIGGRGASVVPAIQQYVVMRGLPPVPKPGVDLQGYTELAGAGWLDSGVRDGALYRHAIPGSFEPHPTADAAVLMAWLAGRTHDPALAARLNAAATAAIQQVSRRDDNYASVAHIVYPLAALVYGAADENAAHAEEAGNAALQQFQPDGSIQYHPQPGGIDLGRTNPTREANGLTAQVVRNVLEAAEFTGDAHLKHEGIRTLRALEKLDHTVPRGAQTWEVPLHTPDILASAYLVRAFTLGYELTGERHFLDEAIYWAWTGVPFVYLRNPTGQPVGPYATIPVLGATHFVAPVWIGLPVQWCGLVYADAVFRLARYNPAGPWKTLADGITASGVQQTWPKGSNTERQGLLPDSFNLAGQIRNDPAINPGTVETNAVRLYGGPALYDFRVFHKSGIMVHAPGAIASPVDSVHSASFRVEGWPNRPYQVLVVGLKSAPRVRVDGRALTLRGASHYDAGTGRLILELRGKPAVTIETGDGK